MKILLIDDEKILSKSISRKLEQNGYEVDTAHCFKDYKRKDPTIYSLFIVDLSLWDGSWFDIIDTIRKKAQLSTPIIIISGHEKIDYKIRGLDSWADDYITKPFAPDELLARIRSVMRRKEEWGTTSQLVYKDIIFDLNTRDITKKWTLISFTKKEKQVIEFFLFHKNELISKRQLTESLWSTKWYEYVTDNTINVTVYKVRKKLGSHFKLETRIGEWYILEEE